MAANVYKFSVDMTCGGCSSAIEKILNKHRDNGIESFSIDLPGKTVTVVSILLKEEILNILKKSGKTVNYLGVN